MVGEPYSSRGDSKIMEFRFVTIQPRESRDVDRFSTRQIL